MNHCATPIREMALLNKYFKPWAACRGADLDSATSGFFRVRNQAKEFHDRGQLTIAACWGQAAAARNAAKDYPEFTTVLAPALVQWLGNGEIEGDASILKHMGVRSRGLSHDLLRASVKVRLEGPPTDELNEVFGVPPHPWLEKVRQKYRDLFGGETKLTQHLRNDSGVKRPLSRRGAAEQTRKRRAEFRQLQYKPLQACSASSMKIFWACRLAPRRERLRRRRPPPYFAMTAPCKHGSRRSRRRATS